MLEIKNTVTKMRDAFDRLFSRLDTAKEESLSLRIYQQKPQKPKCKENQGKKAEQNIPGLQGSYKSCIIRIMVTPQAGERERGNEWCHSEERKESAVLSLLWTWMPERTQVVLSQNFNPSLLDFKVSAFLSLLYHVNCDQGILYLKMCLMPSFVSYVLMCTYSFFTIEEA